MRAYKRVGISGHQSRPNIRWERVANRIKEILSAAGSEARAFTSLAVGTDQVFAREAFKLGLSVTAVIPIRDYERIFKGADLVEYRKLLRRCDVLQLEGEGSDEEAFFAAGKRVADEAELLIAVWDGKPAVGLGGTADIVRYCLSRSRAVAHIDPSTGSLTMLNTFDRQTGGPDG